MGTGEGCGDFVLCDDCGAVGLVDWVLVFVRLNDIGVYTCKRIYVVASLNKFRVDSHSKYYRFDDDDSPMTQRFRNP